MNYTFKNIDACNMCDATKDKFKTLGKRLNSSQGLSPHKKNGERAIIQQCTNCDLIFSNPMPIPSSIQDHYGVPPEDYWIESYFTVDEHYFKGVINWVNNLMPIQGEMKALDIGAGIGKCMIALENSNFDAYGIEPSIPFYERAISKMKIDSEKIQNLSIEDANFEYEYFDFITFGAVLEHLYDPGHSIVKAMQWLKPGGLMHIEVPSAHWLTHKIINRIYKLKRLDYVANLSPMHEPYHLYEFGLKSFQKHSQLHNYQIADYHYIVCDTYLPKILNFVIKPYMKSTNKGMQLALLLRKTV